MTYRWATGTHRGRLRTVNQDRVWPPHSGRSQGPVVVAVADGMGGHAGGEVASSVAIETAIATEGSPEDRVRSANLAVIRRAAEDPSLAGMGTTLTLAELRPEGIAEIAHVGDSRAYLLRDGKLEQLTSDHSLVAEWVAEGRISPEEAERHPQRSMITRALGLHPDVKVDVLEVPLQPGDRLLLCSDGLSSMVGDDRIAEILASHDIDDAVAELIEAANAAGGHDNISVVVVDVEP